jgi:hypothetical protein
MTSRNFIFFLSALAVALVLACLLSPFASGKPDGLEWYAEGQGIHEAETPLWQKAPFSDYTASFASHEGVSTGIAGGIGTLLVFAALFLGGKVIAARNASEQAAPWKP